MHHTKGVLGENQRTHVHFYKGIVEKQAEGGSTRLGRAVCGL